jgi:hypothetical protein
MCVDCVLASSRIAQVDPSQQAPPRGGSVTLFMESKDGTQRMCMDYRSLNEVTVKKQLSFPRST